MRYLFLGLLLPVAACSTYSPETAPTCSNEGREFACRDCGLSIENSARLADGVYRGSQPDAAGFRALKAQGFKSVVNLRSERAESRDAAANGLKVFELPMDAGIFGSTAPSKECIDRFLAIVNDPANRPVFFHCRHGKDRTGTMAAIYRMEVQGWSNDEAMQEMHAFGYHTIYKDLIGCVRDYQCSRPAVN
jgi:tyrosine-protein phosphatase SIW14